MTQIHKLSLALLFMALTLNISAKEKHVNFLDKQIAVAINAMTYPSEGDPQPLQRRHAQLCVLETITPADILDWNNEDPEASYQTYDYAEFMAPRLTTGTPVEQAQWQTLNSIMAGNLAGLTVCVVQVGSGTVHIYVLGLDAIGNMVGWYAEAVQT